MERGTSTNLQQIEGKLLAAFERHAADGRAMTIESLAATAGIAGRPKELALALKHLIERGLLKRAGEDPIPGSAIAFRLIRPALPERLDKAEDQPAPSRTPSSPAQTISPRGVAKPAPRSRSSVLAE
ncbi:hypothetical protein [Bradyrhizobium monzae]|uniref:hypothetical protein n=1 Tax=Bradyrhizobium sp. Oc8 TaxID=2876780 RepID=UPI001F426FFD|nr:hypothetical protein [Bradyrhizobium sp. Oc8]